MEELERVVEHHEHVISDLEGSLCHLEKLVAERTKEHEKDVVTDDDDDDDVSRNSNNSHSGAPYNLIFNGRTTIEDEVNGQHSNMYDRMKAQPRMRFKSRAIRTSFAIYGKKRNPKLV